MTNEQLIERAKEVNLLGLIGDTANLSKAGSREWEGPCPQCGGDDRFHVRGQSWFCRHCHPQFGDPIDYMQWRHNLDFRGAVERLTGETMEIVIEGEKPLQQQVKPVRKPVAQHQPQSWRAKAQALVAESQERVYAAMPYLESRGMGLEAAIAFGLGFRPNAPLPGVWNKAERRYMYEAPAIVTPWYRGGKLVAVRYRFLESQQYTTVDGKQRTVKQSSVSGSEFGGVLYGGHVLPEFCAMPIDPNGKCAEQLRTLVICEGELNAISIWQETYRWKWDVLSLGSESQKLTAAAIDFASRYGRIIVWMDRPEIARRHVAHFHDAVAVNSPEVDGEALDANDMLQRGMLGEFLREVRMRACQDNEEVERVMWYMEGW